MDAIGIDLGTTNSCVGIWKDERVEIVANEDGCRVTPSMVSLTEKDGWLVGKAAQELLGTNAKNTVYDAKRMLGKPMAHPDVQKLSENWQFQLVEKKGLPSIKVGVEGRPAEYLRPWKICAKVLEKLRRIAEGALEQRRVRMAVIGVPANFGDPQKKETMRAAKRAGFKEEQVRFITEPSAAAIAYGFDRRQFDGYRLLVFDFGGGTFDITIIRACKGEFAQLETRGANIGGRDIDKLLFDWCVEQMKIQFGKDIKADSRHARLEQKLMVECIRIKEDLSTQTTSQLDMHKFDVALRGQALKISRDQFNGLCATLLKKTIDLTAQALDNAGLVPKQIDRVLLIGGSTRIPLVRTQLRELFPELGAFDETIDPDQAVAYGATVWAHTHFGGIATKQTPQISLKEIVPLTIGVDSDKGNFIRLIPRGTVIPSTIITETMWTSTNNQKGMTFEFYQGEHEKSEKNIRIGQLELLDTLWGAARQVAAMLNVRVDENGLLEATASYGGEPVRARFNHNVARVDQTEVEKMLKMAAMEAEAEKAKKKRKVAVKKEEPAEQIDQVPSEFSIPAPLKRVRKRRINYPE